jgi:SagB-type dehydrogenase family enzyme
MDSARSGRQFAFLCSELHDPRSIQLHGGFVEAYRRRGAPDDIVEISHELTKLSRGDDLRMLESLTFFTRPFMHSVLFTHDRDYPLRSSIRLPAPTLPDRPFSEVVRGRRSCRSFGEGPLGLPETSALLFGALGETGRMAIASEDGGQVEVPLRSIPSGGGLHPTNIFVAVLRQNDLAPGIYRYDPPEHALELVKPLTEADISALFAAFPIHPAVVNLAQASGLYFITTKFWRSRAKYGPRGYRYCLQEAGSACQNLNLTAVALGLAHVVLGGFYDDEVHACLELDGVDHAVIAAVAVGTMPRQPDVVPRYAEL